MNNEEKENILELLQKFFFKSFLVSFILMILATVLCVFMKETQIAVMKQLFDADEEMWSQIVLFSISIWKILIIQFTLIPAIALYCMRKCKFCECNKN